MGYRNKTYVIFDGDEDMWAYAHMKGWKTLKHIDFDFNNAHDLKPLASNVNNEALVKRRLAERMENTKQVIVVVGEKTKNLYRFVRWEIEQAQRQNIPIVVAYLNKSRSVDNNLCPPILKGKNAVHVAFRMRIIKFALDNFPNYYRNNIDTTKSVNWRYNDTIYKNLGLDE